MQIFVIESLVGIIVFTIMVLIIGKNPLNTINDYPKEIIEWCKELKLITDSQLPMLKRVILRKLFATIIFLVTFVIVIYKFNKAGTFTKGFLIRYGI